MLALRHILETGSRSLSLFLGLMIIILAFAVGITRMDVGEITDWVNQMFGVTFMTLMGGLILAALFCWVRVIRNREDSDVWTEAGLQAANGITTLALTYTLLGISLGIGSLAQHTLTPETIQDIIKELTANFSLAFLTTVIGLPVSAVLRALISISHARNANLMQEA